VSSDLSQNYLGKEFCQIQISAVLTGHVTGAPGFFYFWGAPDTGSQVVVGSTWADSQMPAF